MLLEVRRGGSLEGREVVTKRGHRKGSGLLVMLFLYLDVSYTTISHFVKFIKLDSYDTWVFM